MRRLSEDLKEERLHAANGKLSMAFDILARMKVQKIPADEMVFRSLIDACGRLGNVDLAMKALGEMNAAGFLPDASVYSCLVAAFAMNDKSSGPGSSYQASQTLAMLDWNKMRSRDANSSNGRPKSLNLKLDMKLGPTPKVFKDAFQAFRKMGTPSMNTMFVWGSPSNNNGSSGNGTPKSITASTTTTTTTGAGEGTGGGGLSSSSTSTSRTSSSQTAGGGGDGAAPSSATASPLRQQVMIEAEPKVIHSGSGGSNSSSSNSSSRSQATIVHRSSSGGDGGSGSDMMGLDLELDEAALQDAEEASSDHHSGSSTEAGARDSVMGNRPVSVKRSTSMQCNTPLIKYQVLYGESLLAMLFSDLVMDTDSETCPDCNAKLSSAAIQSGWLPDPNNYTTQCPLCLAARAAEASSGGGMMMGSTLNSSSLSTTLAASVMQHHTTTTKEETASSSSCSSLPDPISPALVGSSIDASASSSSSHPSMSTTTTTVVQQQQRRASLTMSLGGGSAGGISSSRSPPRRFVARFSVHCSDPSWNGSTGPGSLLWCEYLSPWVLRKEVQSIVLNDGIETLTAPTFRTSSQASATIFWNLILWFREHCLPVTFLLQPSVQQHLSSGTTGGGGTRQPPSC